MNDRIAIVWISDHEPVAAPVDSSVVRLSDALVLVDTPSNGMYALFTNTSTVMLVPTAAAADLRAQYFEHGVVTVLHDDS